jgi:hypothetical protein
MSSGSSKSIINLFRLDEELYTMAKCGVSFTADTIEYLCRQFKDDPVRMRFLVALLLGKK